MLTRSTQIPTHARGKVRALVKAHKGFSAQAKNKDLLEFALRHPGLVAQIEALLMPIRPQIAPTASVEAPEATVRIIERLLHEFFMQQQEKPRIRIPMGKAA